MALPAHRPDDIKKTKGLNWEYQCASANSHCPSSFAYDYFAFLSFLFCPAPAAFVVAVAELDTLGHLVAVNFTLLYEPDTHI